MASYKLKQRLLAQWKTIIAIIVLLSIGSYFCYAIVSDSWEEYQLIQRGENIQGYIIEIWEDYEPAEEGGGGYWHYGVTYKYQLADGSEFTGRINGDGRLKSEVGYLTPVEVTYLPDNPGVSRISDELPDNIIIEVFRDSLFECLIAALCLFAGFFLLVLLVREEVKRHKLL